MAWSIKAGVNNGYPYTDKFPTEFRTDFYSDANVKLPYSSWRIKQTVNNGYPWQYWWFKEENTFTGGEMTIGGSQTNYPNGFTNNNRGGISTQFGDGTFTSEFDMNNTAAKCAAAGIAYRSWVIDMNGWAQVVDNINSTSFLDALKTKFEGFMTGVDIFNAVDRIISFPFTLTPIIGGDAEPVTAYGIKDVHLTNVAYGHPARSSILLDFGTINLDVRQAWEIENIDYSIYLPFAGVYQIDVRNAGSVRLAAIVDLVNTLIEYYVMVDNVLIFTAKGCCGVDVTPSNQTGINMSSFIANLPTMVATTAAAVGGIAAAAGTIGAGIAGASAAGSLNAVSSAMPVVGETASQISFPTVSYNSPSIGGSASTMAPLYPRIMAKIPKMHNDAIGFGEILGYKDQVHRRIAECTGFVKCINYKCDIIVATDAEKAEIESLLNSGVFV